MEVEVVEQRRPMLVVVEGAAKVFRYVSCYGTLDWTHKQVTRSNSMLNLVKAQSKKRDIVERTQFEVPAVSESTIIVLSLTVGEDTSNRTRQCCTMALRLACGGWQVYLVRLLQYSMY